MLSLSFTPRFARTRAAFQSRRVRTDARARLPRWETEKAHARTVVSPQETGAEERRPRRRESRPEAEAEGAREAP